ncbi:MAG: ABC transporter permease [Gammaproteobacteria bacterium]|nr:ABC transporter permease [Gammaproteobacteria bacterium]
MNRIVPGVPLDFGAALPSRLAVPCLLVCALSAAAAVAGRSAWLRLVTALGGLAAVAAAAAAAADRLTPPGNLVFRIAPGAGCWLLLACAALLAVDAAMQLRPGPIARVLGLVICLGATGMAFSRGVFDDLSIMREYAVHAHRFAAEALRHLELAFGSLAAAVAFALPLGLMCHRLPSLRAPTLSLLNVVQTIPSIALFGILMAPLAALSAAVPLAAKLGIEGIGAAPAVVALFLYSLLPIVANTALGLQRVSPAAIEAARGMGLTEGQILRGIELPLALPAILAGIRIVLIQNIGLTTIAALIGAGGLGTFVFQGIGQTAIDLVLLGALPTVALAVASGVLLDALIESIDRSRA